MHVHLHIIIIIAIIITNMNFDNQHNHSLSGKWVVLTLVGRGISEFQGWSCGVQSLNPCQNRLPNSTICEELELQNQLKLVKSTNIYLDFRYICVCHLNISVFYNWTVWTLETLFHDRHDRYFPSSIHVQN